MGRPGLVITLLLFSVAARAQADDERFAAVTKQLVKAVNTDDQKAIQALFAPAMQDALPAAKTGPFFRGVVQAKGKLVEIGPPQVSGATATLLITTERGAWEFLVTLDEMDRIAGFLVRPPKPQTPAPPRNRTKMSLPFQGEWFVFWGGDNEQDNYHVNVPGQRRAADLIMVDAAGTSHRGNGAANEDYFCYGQPILAPAAGTVVTAIDGVPDNSPGSMNPLCAVGNCLIIQHAAGEFAVLAHFKPHSIRVKSGDKVERGQTLGLCGNSGNSSEPHLHFHLQTSGVMQDGVGFTQFFSDVQLTREGKTTRETDYAFLKGDRVSSAPTE
ncbi:MAG: peptidoglycan DD-metalloendopeptidase family protein [Planctomycetota bacterium]